MSDADPLSRAMAVIEARARLSNTTRAEVVSEALDALRDGGLDEDLRTRAVAAAHQLVGSAGTFGHPVASARARELEQFLRGPERGADARSNAARVLAELREDLGRSAG